VTPLSYFALKNPLIRCRRPFVRSDRQGPPRGPVPASPVTFDPMFRMFPVPVRDGRGSKRDQAGILSGSGGGRPDALLVVVDRFSAGAATVLFFSCSSVSTAILVALWARTPQPHHVRAPSMPSSKVRSQPHECLR